MLFVFWAGEGYTGKGGGGSNTPTATCSAGHCSLSWCWVSGWSPGVSFGHLGRGGPCGRGGLGRQGARSLFGQTRCRHILHPQHSATPATCSHPYPAHVQHLGVHMQSMGVMGWGWSIRAIWGAKQTASSNAKFLFKGAWSNLVITQNGHYVGKPETRNLESQSFGLRFRLEAVNLPFFAVP